MSSELIAYRAGGQAGFTLLELLVVTAILGLIAYAALDSVAQDTSPIRYDDTRIKLASIRNAVLGTPPASQSLGTTGFIADMGRVPENPQELMTMPGGSGVAVTAWHLDIDASTTPSTGTGLGVGWRGPYLHAFRETQCVNTARTTCSAASTGEVALRDGWGNTASGEEFNDDGTSAGIVDLFGWRRFGQDTKGNFYVQSYGSDGAKDDSALTLAEFNAQDVYTRDYPPAAPKPGATTVNIGVDLPAPLVAVRDYQIQLPALVSIQLTNATSGPMPFNNPSNPYVCASLHYIDVEDDGTSKPIKTLLTSASAAPLPASLDPGGIATIDLTVPAIPATSTSATRSWLPAGQLALRLRYVTSADAPCGTLTNGTPTSAAPLLQHTYDSTTPNRCATDAANINLSPGLACGTRIIATVPPQLPQQINVSLTW